MSNTTMIMLVLPIGLLQLGLQIGALVSLFRRKTLKIEKKILWTLVILLTGIIGPIIYFAFKKGE
jgi:hypothetical protein